MSLTAYFVYGIKCNGLVKQGANFVRFEWSTVPALSLGKGLIWLHFHSVLPCFMLASPMILCFTADVTTKLQVFLEFLYISHEFCFLWAPASYSQCGRIDGDKVVRTVCGFGEGNCMSPFSWTVEWDELRGFCWVLLYFVGFLVLFCGGAKKGSELLRSIDEVRCTTASDSFHIIIGVLAPLGSKSCKFSWIFWVKKSNMYTITRFHIETHQANLYLISSSPWSLLPGSLQFHPLSLPSSSFQPVPPWPGSFFSSNWILPSPSFLAAAPSDPSLPLTPPTTYRLTGYPAGFSGEIPFF